MTKEFENIANTIDQYKHFTRPKMTQVLTQEQINKLRNNDGNFDLRLSEEDIFRAICTHKDKNGQFALIENPDETVCSICGQTFKTIKDN